MKYVIILFSLFAFVGPAFAESDFCKGFELGYKTIKGNGAFVPFCPFEPFTPFGSTPFQEGIKAGMRAASE